MTLGGHRFATAVCVSAAVVLVGPLAAPAHAADFQVINSFDVGAGSLRQAITDANANANSGPPDTISFGDLGSNPKITPDTPLPTITEAVTINGYTHPGASPNTRAVGNDAVLKVELSGEDFLGGTPTGLAIAGGGTTVRGLVINRFDGAAIRIETNGGNVVEGNFIGTDRTGTVDLTGIPNVASDGVLVDNSAANTIGGSTAAARNVISGNGNHGVVIGGTPNSDGNLVQGNYIGTTKSGTVALGNDAAGVRVFGDAADTRLGGTTLLTRNVISSNFTGVSIEGDGIVGTRVQGNYIGTSAAGTADLGNTSSGVDSFMADSGVVGGSAAGERNVISGNGGSGVNIRGGVGAAATGNVVQGNRIGTNAAGTAALGNFDGIQVHSNATDTTIGGLVAGARNIISGNNQNGVFVSNTGNRIQGNFIGTNAAGTAALANDKSGILLFGNFNDVGGTVAAARNVVSGNGGNGIEVHGFSAILGNYVGTNAAGTAAVPNLNGIAAHTQAFIGLSSTPLRTPFGNVISGNRKAGVLISGEFTGNVEVDGNLIGTNPAGTAAIPNSDGIVIEDGASSSALGFTARNVISGNDFAGVLIRDPGFGHNSLYENYIGLNRAGTGAVPNGIGVELANGATDNHIGTPTVAKRNVIAGNRFEGIHIHGAGTDRNEVVRAFVGIRRDAVARGNARGIVISDGAARNTVGGTDAALANTISGNQTDGVLITGAETNRNVVRGNSIGTTPSGDASRPNSIGVNITAGARFNTIGGSLNQPQSLISGNRNAGVRVADAATLGNRIQGNHIGTAPNGTTARPNGAGVIVTAGAQATTIGGIGPLANRIALNTGSGVLIDAAATTGAELVRNQIFGNGKLGINLRPPAEAADTVTPNDPGDPDAGPNALQNFPVISAANGAGTTTTVSGALNSRPNASYRIEVFRNPAGTGSSSEAMTFAGATTVTTNASGNATWSVNFSGDHTGEVLRATATKLDTRDTSELSATRVVG